MKQGGGESSEINGGKQVTRVACTGEGSLGEGPSLFFLKGGECNVRSQSAKNHEASKR
jgi:hypothetical protein